MIENERIEELPLNGRNATDLIALAPAAVPQPGLNATSRSMQGGQAFAVAGGQAFGVAYLLDGATHNNPYDNLNLPLPFPDALQEFRLETSSTHGQHRHALGRVGERGHQVGHQPVSRRPVRVRPQPSLQRHQPVQRSSTRRPASGRATA